MTDQDQLLALGAQYYIPWLEEQKALAVSALVGAYTNGGETKDKVAEIAVLDRLIRALRAKERAAAKKQEPK